MGDNVVQQSNSINTDSDPKIIKVNNENNQTLSFNNTDKILDMGTNKEKEHSAPKDVKTLETISDTRHIKRKIEEAEEEAEEAGNGYNEKLNIIDTNIKLDEVMDLNNMKLTPSLIPTNEIEILK